MYYYEAAELSAADIPLFYFAWVTQKSLCARGQIHTAEALLSRGRCAAVLAACCAGEAAQWEETISGNFSSLFFRIIFLLFFFFFIYAALN